MKKLTILPLCLLASFAYAQAAIPQLINYQGLLLEENGSKVTGIKAITLKVFTGATDGNGTKEIYQENVGNVSVTDGLYSFNFGGSGQSVISTNEIVGNGDGSTQIFNYTVDNPPVLDGTAVITKYDENDTVISTWSQTDGSSESTFISSVVNSTGAVSVTNSAGAPASGEYIQINYDYNSVGIMGALSSNPTAWLEVSVDGSPLLPRQRLVAVPFANVAGTIQGENLSVNPITGDVHVKNRIVFGDEKVGTTTGFGDWVDKTRNVVHQAETDGYVMMTNSSDVTSFWFQLGDSSTPANFAYMKSSGYYNRLFGTAVIPVKKGKFWKVATSDTDMKVKWMSVGF